MDIFVHPSADPVSLSAHKFTLALPAAEMVPPEDLEMLERRASTLPPGCRGSPGCSNLGTIRADMRYRLVSTDVRQHRLNIKRLHQNFAPRFFQAPPRGECHFTLALRYHFTSIVKRTFTSKRSNIARHTKRTRELRKAPSRPVF